MYIEDVVLESHVLAYRPNKYGATLKLDCIEDKQAELIMEMYRARQDICISPQDNSSDNNKLKKTIMNKVVKVIYNKPATIVFWSDGTKTVVKCEKKDKYDPEKGFFIACTKKLFGNNYAAVGKMNRALELAVDVSKKEK